MKTVAFFNNKGDVGKTSLVYHLAHMFADLGIHTVAIDLDPQANLTSMFLEESELEAIWAEVEDRTIYGAIRPLIEGEGDVAAIRREFIRRELSLPARSRQILMWKSMEPDTIFSILIDIAGEIFWRLFYSSYMLKRSLK